MRDYFNKIVVFSGVASLAACNTMSDVEKESKPNILIVIADDMSFPHAGAYGCSWIKTPAFDRVAEEGILFNNAYTTNAKSSPSRACLLTGQYSWQLEEAANHIGIWPENKFPTIFETLSANGYTAAYTGKGWEPGNPGVKDGKPRQLTGTPYQKKRLTPPTTGIAPIDYAANFADFLDDMADNDAPWIFWYGSKEPHRVFEYGTGKKLGEKSTEEIDRLPAFYPDNEVVRNDLLDYAFEIEHFDAHLGYMLSLLEEKGELSNTIIIVTADNGMAFPRIKGFQYEYSNHMPLAIMWKQGIINPGRSEDCYISFVDIVPTLLEISQVDQHKMNPSGKSLTDLFNNRPKKDRSYILLGQERHDYGRPMNQGYPIRSIVKDGFIYIHNFKPDLWPAGNPETGYLNTDGSPTKTEILKLRREGRDTYFWNLSFGKHPQEELYHIETDPDCLINLAASPLYAEKKEKMKTILFSELIEQKDPRILNGGEIFDKYPFMDQSSYYFYERYMNGEIEEYQTDWVNPSDYEKEKR